MADLYRLFSQLFQCFKTLLATVRLLHDTFNHEHKIPPFNGSGELILSHIGWGSERAGLQKF